MKTLLLLLVLTLTLCACGGSEYQFEEIEDWEIDVQMCEAQDGIAQVLNVYNTTTGESYKDVDCDFGDDKEAICYAMCANSGNCPRIECDSN